jgi:glycine cleavage system H protein
MVEPPKIGRKVKSGEAVGTIEAVKAVSDLYAALSGEVVAVNEAVVKDPSLINKDPYNQGWLYKVKVENAKEADSLLTSDQYKELVASH